MPIPSITACLEIRRFTCPATTLDAMLGVSATEAWGKGNHMGQVMGGESIQGGDSSRRTLWTSRSSLMRYGCSGNFRRHCLPHFRSRDVKSR